MGGAVDFWLPGSMCATDTQAGTGVQTQEAEPRTLVRPKHQPLYHVVLLDDDQHTYDYVIEMLGRLFGHSPERGYQLACEVDGTGRAIVDTTSLERAEFKRDQIRAYGPDWRLKSSRGSMAAVIEPAE